MRIPRVLTIMLLLAGLASTSSAAGSRVFLLELDDTIQPASLRYLERGLDRAADENAALVLIELDTPGGLLVSLRSMTSAILASPVPVVVYVTPSGAHAASAGFFLLIAADVAAMAPGTNTGAAHPVTIGQKSETEDPAIDKAIEDAAALARSLAAGRGRSVEWAEKTVRESAAYTADEARAHELVDVIASDRESLLRALDGKSIKRFDGTTRILELRGAEIVPVEHTLAERVLGVIADPSVAYLLLMVGAIGVLIELMSPGFIVPGVAGALSLLLGLYGMSVLPVNVVGALLIAAGLGLIVAEVFAATYGALAVAGVASFVVGSLMLVDSPIPDLRIGPEMVIPIALVLAGITVALGLRALRSRHAPQRSGFDAMIGERGTLVEPITAEHDGKVFVHGEYWSAAAAQPLPTGAEVRVEAREGLRLRVAVTEEQGAHV